MTSTYDARGRRVGATRVEVMSNFITQVKTTGSKDGYNAIQLGFGTKKSVRKPQLGHGKAVGIDKPIRWFREIRLQSTDNSQQTEDLKPGTEIKLDQVFSIGDMVKVTGTSKGKGFQGGVRRHGFHGGPKTHGQSDRHRAPGSIGSGTTPGRVYKGKKMAGHMGVARTSTSGLEVVGVSSEKNLLIIKGAVPGPTGGLVIVNKLGKIKGYTPPPEEKPEEGGEEAEKSAQQVEPVESASINSASVAEATSAAEATTADKGEQNAG